MYIPKINQATDKEEIKAFMQRFSFATLVSATDNIPVATHLPFLVGTRGDDMVLSSHFAKANDQWKNIGKNPALVIFAEPHAYISPAHYEKELNVPTWNYISVHAYGHVKLITETPDVMRLLEATIDTYEKAYHDQWDRLPADYKIKMSRAIVAFEMVVSDLQAKTKLSQNKTEEERRKIIDTLSKRNDTNEQVIAEFMSRGLE